MMKTLIYQCYIGKIPSWVNVSVERFKKYSKLHNSEYMFDTKERYQNCYFNHLCLIYDNHFEKYDKILYVDIDVIPENFDENIFDEQIEHIGSVQERERKGHTRPPGFSLPHRAKQYEKAAELFDVPIVETTNNAPYLMFNSGVMLWSKEGLKKARATFMDWKEWNSKLHGQMALDQPFMNGQITKHLKYTELDVKWNCAPRIRFEEGAFPEGMNFLHYTGGKKRFIEESYNEK